MNSLLPEEAIAAKFERPVSFEELGFQQLENIWTRKRSSMYEIGLTVWTHHLEMDPATDPRALAEYVDRGDPHLLNHIADRLRRDVLFDIQYSIGRLQDERLEYNVVAEVLAAFVYPGYLHVSDIEFTNPYHPIPEERRKYRFQRYAGLKMFNGLLERIVIVARNIGATHISLTAAAPDLVPFFQKFGFEVEDNAAGEYGLAHGLSVPMRQKL